MFRVIHPNRWFFWTIASVFAAGFLLVFFILRLESYFEQQALELTLPASEDAADPSYFGWKILRFESLGILVKYPPHWVVEIEPGEGSAMNLQNPENFSENISIYMVDVGLEQTIRDLVDVASEREVLIDKNPGVWLTGSDTKDKAISNVILVRHSLRLYYFAGWARAFEKIMAGVKFINE